MMEDERYEVAMRVLEMSTVLKPSDAYALVLEELGEPKRKLALIIGALEAQAIRMAQMHYKPPRPFTHDLMLNVLAEGGLTLLKGVISKVNDGIYYAELHVQRTDGTRFTVDARSTDVISLSMRSGFPLFVPEGLLEREQLRNVSEDGSTYTVSLNTVNLSVLKREMQTAIEREDYERASQLRDEIRRREKEQPKSEPTDERIKK